MRLTLKQFKQEFCGIYILYSKGIPVYVGQSVNVVGRIGTHLTEDRKKFDEIEYISCPPDKLNELEIQYIKALNPKYNYIHNKKNYSNIVSLLLSTSDYTITTSNTNFIFDNSSYLKKNDKLFVKIKKIEYEITPNTTCKFELDSIRYEIGNQLMGKLTILD